MQLSEDKSEKQPSQPQNQSGQSGKKWRPRLIIIIIILLVAAGCWWLVQNTKAGGGKSRTPNVLAVVATVGHKDIPVYLNGLGTIQAYNTVTVHSQVDGQLMQVLFHEGQDVRKGEVLAKIDPRTFQAQYDQAVANKAKDEATLANAELDLKRYESLGDDISQQTVDTQRATVKQLAATVKADQAAIDNTHAELTYTTITSPIDGRTGIRQVDIGNLVHASDANGIVVITQLDPIYVLFSLPQQNIQAINDQLNNQDKLTVVATAADGTTPVAEGELDFVDNQIDQTTGTVKLKAVFPNDKHELWPGGFINVRLLLNTVKDAIFVPTVSIQRGPSGTYVYVAKVDDTVEMRPVQTSVSEGLDTVITNGLKEGERVVTDGMEKLQDGAHINISGEKSAGNGNANGEAQPADEKKHRHRNSEQ